MVTYANITQLHSEDERVGQWRPQAGPAPNRTQREEELEEEATRQYWYEGSPRSPSGERRVEEDQRRQEASGRRVLTDNGDWRELAVIIWEAPLSHLQILNSRPVSLVCSRITLNPPCPFLGPLIQISSFY